MLKISLLKRFKKDHAQYNRDIEKISNEKVKEYAYTLLNKLIQEYSYIDAVHDVTNKSIDPTKVRENVERSVDLRIELDKIIKDSKS